MTLTYFIPDWDDRVDPTYDFLRDEHTPNRNPYRDDRYAHELYTMPPYDGILLSRAVLDSNSRKRSEILAAGSVHSYLRLPADGSHSVLGDCGAFTYWQEEEPPYKTEEMLEFYQSLGFDFGVSIDHLIFAELEEEKERRWKITVDNADKFLKQHKQGQGKYTFTPIGVAQGWDPDSYQRAARELMRMGYGYIAIGGLVRSQTDEVTRVLSAVKKVLRPGTQVHLFGVNRPEHMQTFASLGVTSFDSASRLRRAWMDSRQNYFLGSQSYTAIRIPEADKLAKSLGLDPSITREKEQKALDTLRRYDHNTASYEDTLAAVIEYAELTGKLNDRVLSYYERTLRDRPWKACTCDICRQVGVEVIIFRGNNRNRRRGFHNTWQLYQQILEGRRAPADVAADMTYAEPL